MRPPRTVDGIATDAAVAINQLSPEPVFTILRHARSPTDHLFWGDGPAQRPKVTS
jgi:hypothetical protein